MFLIAIVLLVAIVMVAGFLARRRLDRRTAPAGRLVDVGGYRLHVDVRGEGEPTVVFDAGAGASGLVWRPLQEQVAAFTRAVSYDRAGLGWSEPGRRPRTNRVMVEELHELLQRAAIAGPYILVGHSLGGLNARLYAHLYPDEVAGLVLVDAVHEEQFSPPEVRPMSEKMGRMGGMMMLPFRVLSATGLAALRPALMGPAISGVFGKGAAPAGLLESYRNLIATRPAHHATAAAELQAILPAHEEIQQMGITLPPELPVTVITHGRSEESPMLPQDVARVAEETFLRLQGELAAQTARGRQVVAEESGHNIPFEQPELIIEAIQEMVAEVRRGSGTGVPVMGSVAVS